MHKECPQCASRNLKQMAEQMQCQDCGTLAYPHHCWMIRLTNGTTRTATKAPIHTLTVTSRATANHEHGGKDANHKSNGSYSPLIQPVFDMSSSRDVSLNHARAFARKRRLFSALPATTAMTPTQYATAIKSLGLSQRSAAKVLGVDERTSRKWIAGDNKIPEPVAKLLRLAIRLKLDPEELR